MKSTAAPVQDMAPVGGFQQTVKYKRNLPSRGPSGALLLAASVAMMSYGFYSTMNDNAERRELKREKIWARIQLVPLLMAETDRDTVRRLDSLAAKESQIMKDHPNWAPMDLKAPVPGLDKLGKRSDTAAEPVYHTERYVSPTMVFLPNDNFMSAQWWRGTKVFTSNPEYHKRDDFTKEHPIGQ
ncbi:GRIM-19 protein-domain-containing protein [Globomyces pollinis-pini]|nr:GRIM-19 protein-domain-containing protein [Globomyces pollinis-pini]